MEMTVSQLETIVDALGEVGKIEPNWELVNKATELIITYTLGEVGKIEPNWELVNKATELIITFITVKTK